MEFREWTLPFRQRILVGLIALLALVGLVSAQQAAAADITGRVTTTKTVAAGTYDQWQTIRVDMTWAVPTAATGDTFRMPLDKMLDARKFVPMALKDAAGATVANVAIVRTATGAYVRDAAGNAILEFTFTNYAATHTNLSGKVWFMIGFDQTKLSFPGTTTSMDTVIYDVPVTITAERGPVGSEYNKYGFWLGSEAEATAQNPDGTNANAGPDIIWNIQLQGGAQSRAAGWTKATIVDTPGPGSHFECPLVLKPWAVMDDPTTAITKWIDTTAVQVTVASCSRTSLTIVVTKAASDNNIYLVRFPGWIDDGVLPNGFGNTATLKYDGPNGQLLTHPVSTLLSRAAAGGDGTGENTFPKIDIENYCGAWTGVTFNGLSAVLGADGQPTPQPAPCDYDTAPGLSVGAGKSTNVTFRITNVGTETLNNVVVTDTTTAGAALKNIVCVMGESSVMPFNGLMPGESFLCTATLPAISAKHGNLATVTAVGATSELPVTDSDAWHAQPTSVLPPSGKPKLAIKKVATVSVIKAGQSVKWRVSVRNSGTAAAKSVKVCDVLRESQAFKTTLVTYVIGSVKKTVRMTVKSGKGCFTIPSLGAGKTAVFTVTTIVPRSARKLARNTATAVANGVTQVSSTAAVKIIGVLGVNLPSPTG